MLRLLFCNMKETTILNQCIKKSGYAKKDIAEAIGVSGATVSNWCAGKTSPRPAHIAALSSLLKMEAAVLTGEKPMPLPDSYEEFREFCSENGIGLMDILAVVASKGKFI